MIFNILEIRIKNISLKWSEWYIILNIVTPLLSDHHQFINFSLQQTIETRKYKEGIPRTIEDMIGKLKECLIIHFEHHNRK